MVKTIKGDILYMVNRSELREMKDSYLVIEDGRVVDVFKTLPEEYSSYELFDFTGKLIVPGMSDLHVHAPQYQFRGIWMDKELLDWLNNHTFPEEGRYEDEDYAEKAYSIFADDLKSSTTTRFAIFGTIHNSATLMLMDKLDKLGLKGFVGKVSMDRNCPDYLTEKNAYENALEFLAKADFENVKPIVTPRFLPAVTDELMEKLGELSVERDLPLQSHLSENPGEIEWVKELCPESESYADAYRRRGVWGRVKTIMAHCVYSDRYEKDMMFDENIYIAHCADSNVNLTSGVIPASMFLDGGANIGLGSDVAAGSSLSICSAMRDSVKASKMRKRLFDEKVRALTFKDAFYMATMGGGSFFGKVGSFEKGYEADIVVIDDSRAKSTLIKDLNLAERMERYVNVSPDEKVLAKFVAGRRVI